MTAEPLSSFPNDADPDPTLALLSEQLVLSLQGKLGGHIGGTYRLLSQRILDALPVPTSERLRKAPQEGRALLAETLENLLRSDPRTRQLISVILTPPDERDRGHRRKNNGKVRVVVLISQPKRMGSSKLAWLRTDQEWRQIDEALRRASLGGRFELIPIPAARTEDLSWCLLAHEPDIVHFCGHGYGGAIMVQRKDGSARLITGEQLARLFEIFKGTQLRCVVLNACQTGAQAEPIARAVGAAVARPDNVPDTAAIIFAEHFYEALGFGKTLQEAFELGCWQVEAQWKVGGETAKPQLLGEAREIRFAG